MSNLIVVRDEVDGWDVVREDDPQSLTNTATKESAIEVSSKEVSISCPSPVRCRAIYAHTMPKAANMPVPISAIGTPAFAGGMSGCPVALMIPLIA